MLAILGLWWLCDDTWRRRGHPHGCVGVLGAKQVSEYRLDHRGTDVEDD